MDDLVIPEDLLSTLEGSVGHLKVVYADNQGSPLNDDVIEVMQLCVTVEGILRHLQKEKVSFWGERRDYWNYLSESVGEMKALDSIVKMIQAQTQLSTGQGRGRSLIRECLCEKLLADCIQTAISNTKRTKEWYHYSAILLSPNLSQRVLNALYDLSDVTFDLQTENIDLDETWPSFVKKSFSASQSSAESSDSSQLKNSLFGSLGASMKYAKVADKSKPNNKRTFLERAVEEHPSEVFVKHEVPFNLELVGTLLANIRSDLIGHEESNEQIFPLQSSIPELKVEKLDDITSCLTLLDEYIGSWASGVVTYSGCLMDEIKLLKDKYADLGLQLQETLIESETSETSLISQIHKSRNDIKMFSGEANHLSIENKALQQENHELKQKVTELETMNFNLEEQLVRSSDDDSRGRAYTILEAVLAEKNVEIEQASSNVEEKQAELQQLRQRLQDTQMELQTQAVSHESFQKSEEKLKSEIEGRKDKETELMARYKELESSRNELAKDLEEVKNEMESMTSKLKEKSLMDLQQLNDKLEVETEKCQTLISERDQARDELNSMHGVIENETASLRFQVSSQAIDLQRARELSVKQDKIVSGYKSRMANLESQLGEMNERCGSAEGQIDELKTELQDMEGILNTNKDELSSLNEQLTEKTVSRDLDRSQALKQHAQIELVSMRVKAEKTEMSKQVDKLNVENEDLRKAFKKLLQQKVTLWQHADKLEQEHVAKGEWINEKTVTECMGCGMVFSVFNRKHHCRSCGKVFCTTCCEKKAKLPFSKAPMRVCKDCHDKILDVRTPFAAKMINTLDSESIMLSQAVVGMIHATCSDNGDSLDTTSSANSLNISRSLETNGNSLQAKLLIQNSDSLPSIADSTSTMSGNSSHKALLHPDLLDSKEHSQGTDNQSLHSVSSVDYAVDPELKLREAERLQQPKTEEMILPDANVTISSVVGASDDDSYILIDTTPQTSVFPVGLDTPGTLHLDVDALATKLASLKVTNDIERSHARRVSDSSLIGGLSSPKYKEATIEGGGLHKVTVSIDKLGTAIAWEFSTEPKGIAFGIWYKEDRDSEEVEVLPLKRCSSHRTILTGEYIAQKIGVYMLKFDNCHSKYGGRKLLYKVWSRVPF